MTSPRKTGFDAQPAGRAAVVEHLHDHFRLIALFTAANATAHFQIAGKPPFYLATALMHFIPLVLGTAENGNRVSQEEGFPLADLIRVDSEFGGQFRTCLVLLEVSAMLLWLLAGFVVLFLLMK